MAKEPTIQQKSPKEEANETYNLTKETYNMAKETYNPMIQ